MGVIYRYRLTTAEAEDLIARLWRALEEHGALSPRLRVHQAGEALDLHVAFLSDEDAALIRRVVPPLVTRPALISHCRSDRVDWARINHWRMRAEELRTTAEQFHNPSARRSLLSAAANYEKLAEDAERSLTGHPSFPGDQTG
jgi:hypothetical protein